MTQRRTKDLLFAAWAGIAKGLSSPKRLELLDVLANGERSVEVLANETNLSVANASAHLMALKRAHLVVSRKQTQFVFYRLTNDGVVRLLHEIQSFARRSVREVEEVVELYFEANDALSGIDAAELSRRLRAGEVTLIDVRPAAEYRAGHIPGALSVPLADLAGRVRSIPKERPVVAYCRGPYCVLAAEAAKQLQRRGYHVRRYSEGYPGWKAGGHRVRAGGES